MKLRQRTYVLLVIAVAFSSATIFYLGPKQQAAETSCAVSKITLALEVCPASDVKTILGHAGSGVRTRVHDQTLVDFVLIVSYVGLWGATGLSFHPGVALAVAAAGATDVIENLGILHELSLPNPLSLVRWVGLAKWGLLGLIFTAFALLFQPTRISGGWGSSLRAAVGIAYGVSGVALLIGLYDVRFLELGVLVTMVAVFLQFLLHVLAHEKFEAIQPRRTLSPASSTASLSLEQVLRKEFECLHAPAAQIPEAGGLSALYETIHNLDEKRTALCLSGGGIRSATFGLGVLQGLATVLPNFHYLSTVSGGGYIGAWLTAWLHRSGNDLGSVASQLRELDPANKLNPEPLPISRLRDYTNYLAPRQGLLSADTWTLVGTMSRNLILVWVVLVPFLGAGLIAPRLYVALIQDRPALSGSTALDGYLLLGLGGAALAWAVAYIGASIPSSTTASRSQGRFLGLCLLPLLISGVCLTLYWAWWPIHNLLPFVIFGVIVHLFAWVGYTVWLLTPWGYSRATTFRAWLLGTLLEGLVAIAAGAIAGIVAGHLANLFLDGRGQLNRWTAAFLYPSFAPAAFLAAFLLGATLLVGFLCRLTDDDDREWWARCGSWMLVAGVTWTVLSLLIVWGPLIFSRTLWGTLVATVGGVSGLIGLAGGRSAWSAAKSIPMVTSGRSSILGRVGLPAAAAVFAAILLVVLSLVTSGLLGLLLQRFKALALTGSFATQCGGVPLTHVCVLLTSSPLLVVIVGAGLALLGGGAAWLINTNTFSLHAMYRARLIRAYLGASNLNRHTNDFTGFDSTDDIQMHELWPNLPPGQQPLRKALFHVANMTLNLVHGDNLAWQERKAHTFTVTPLHAGSVAVVAGGAYRPTNSPARPPYNHYGGPQGVSLGTATTISGAAASPNMGYHSSPLVTFLMTLFNVRLGSWLGNPGPAGDNTFFLESPRFTVRPIVAEALGLTDRTSPYVYLSDGGHFDNLGLYEMILRRCHFIVVCDAGCDPKCGLTDLGGAIRKIRADLGIPIDFPRGIPIYPRSTGGGSTSPRGLYWAVGRIHYSIVDPPAPLLNPAQTAAANEARDGWLLYIKPAFYGTEPADIYEYAIGNEQFPHESTVDQFFSESQFESYRMLGLHAINQLCDGWHGGSLPDLMRHARTRWSIGSTIEE